jgi:integrase
LPRLHLLTGGQRLQQLARGTVEDIAEGVLVKYDGKGRRSKPRRHPAPLLPKALDEIERLGAGELGPLVYMLTRGVTAVGYSATRERPQPVAAAMVAAGEVAEPFTLGDLRRTVESRLAALGIGTDVRARLQSHGLGATQARHYDRRDRAEELRAALERLRELDAGQVGEVVRLHRSSRGQ